MKKIKRVTSLIVFVLVLFTACATPNYSSRDYSISSKGEVNRIEPKENTGDIEYIHAVRSIKLYTNKIPEGFEITRGEVESSLKMSPAAKNRYEVVSFFELEIPYYTNFGTNNAEWWFYDYRPEENWKRYYCYPQTVLSWLTLWFWNLVPLKYPCNVSRFHLYTPKSFGLDATRREMLMNGARAEVYRKNGTFGILSVFGDRVAAGWVIKDLQKEKAN